MLFIHFAENEFTYFLLCKANYKSSTKNNYIFKHSKKALRRGTLRNAFCYVLL